MVVILVITVRPEAIFLIVSWVAWDLFVGVHLFDMMRGVLVKTWRGDIVAGAILRRHGGQQEGIRSVKGNSKLVSDGINNRKCHRVR